MVEPTPTRWLHRFAVFTAAMSLLLLGAGGMVTSKGVGMAVPDWPNTYGYNLFFFPVSQWVGGIFYEHTHRLIASAVGMLTCVLALWLHGRNARGFMRWAGLALIAGGALNLVFLPKRWEDGLVTGVTGLALAAAGWKWPAGEPAPKWLRRMGLIAVFAVVLQGVLGGLRVVLLRDQLGIFHATLAQLFFALICSIALFTSRWWQNLAAEPATPVTGSPKGFRTWLVAITSLILFQLILGAAMRHQHAGLSIPDFPLAYGKLWPATDPQSVAFYNEHRMEVVAVNPITAFQIELQMLHRIVALLILAGVGVCAWQARKWARAVPAGSGADAEARVLRGLTAFWLALIVAQAVLGACTIWSHKAADIATAHVLVGALSLVTGVISCIVSFRNPESARHAPVLPGAVVDPQTGPLGANPAAAQ